MGLPSSTEDLSSNIHFVYPRLALYIRIIFRKKRHEKPFRVIWFQKKEKMAPSPVKLKDQQTFCRIIYTEGERLDEGGRRTCNI
ncbi:hypothetical protein Anas_14494 [Armadillidium nasatum]|uniref:Uncharacterized protein n=1 Tax=Armadillidium nasatum TaxID=96803 RepID=A0A5N5SZD3_9CRUS|nr:hypothetical protein Anas_14494 [Armadillidium nasatum]